MKHDRQVVERDVPGELARLVEPAHFDDALTDLRDGEARQAQSEHVVDVPVEAHDVEQAVVGALQLELGRGLSADVLRGE